VVLDFYHKVGDTRDWSEQSLLKYFDANFIQHDPSEPSTAKAYAQFMGGLVPRTPAGNGQPRTGGAYPMPGSTPKDANNSPVEWLFADGDIVVAVRRRNWDWPGGPESVFNGIFVDVWRVQHAKITEQWCSCTLADARLKHIAEAKAAGYWKK
jgi:predicted SnoaL-like aldol condensation-catalyzing enzyme